MKEKTGQDINFKGIGTFFAAMGHGFVAVLKACFIDMPIGWIVVGIVAISSMIGFWLVPSVDHDQWKKCASFCRVADCYIGPEAVVDNHICECYRLSDHAKVWISTEDGSRMVEDVH